MRGLADLSSAALTLRSKRLRYTGHYNRALLEDAFAAWRLNSSAQNLLHWASTRRDMGLPLSRRLAMKILEAMPSSRPVQRAKSVALVVESFPVWVKLLPEAWRQDAVLTFPALGIVLAPGLTDQGVAWVGFNQAVWRPDFANAVRDSVTCSGVSVVGNAADIWDACLEDAIDASALVVRFNHYGRGPGLQACVGTKTNVWVVSPAYKGPPPVEVPEWVVVTGPSMEFKLKNWSVVEPLLSQGSKVLTVPLEVWYVCVQQLQAPPSAGFLLLCWFNNILGGDFTGVRVAGLGGHKSGQPYQALNPQKGRTDRHNWLAEQAWLDTMGMNTQFRAGST